MIDGSNQISSTRVDTVELSTSVFGGIIDDGNLAALAGRIYKAMSQNKNLKLDDFEISITSGGRDDKVIKVTLNEDAFEKLPKEGRGSLEVFQSTRALNGSESLRYDPKNLKILEGLFSIDKNEMQDKGYKLSANANKLINPEPKKSILDSVFKSLDNAVKAVIEPIKTLIEPIKKKFDPAVDLVDKNVKAVQDEIQSVRDNKNSENYNKLLDKVGEVDKQVDSKIKAVFKAADNVVKSGIKSAKGSIRENIDTVAPKVTNKIVEVSAELAGTIDRYAKKASDALGTDGIKETIKGKKESEPNLVTKIKNEQIQTNASGNKGRSGM